MRVSIAYLGLLWFTALTACQEKTVIVEKRDDGIIAAAPAADAQPQTKPQTSTLPEIKTQEKSPYQKFPPVFTLAPSVTPEPGRRLVFGYSPSAPSGYQTVFFYTVAALPDFENGEEIPLFETEAEFIAFMEKWASDFAKDPMNVKKLEDMAKETAWTVDPAFIDDQPQTIDPRLLEAEPNYAKLTQKTLARRFTFKANGQTLIKGKLGNFVLDIPVEINPYTEAERALGETRYLDPANGCVGCHGKSQMNAYLKHSSEYLSFYNDTELLEVIQNGDDILNFPHSFSLTPEEQRGIVAHLRNGSPFYDRIIELLKGLNLQAPLLSLKNWF